MEKPASPACCWPPTPWETLSWESGHFYNPSEDLLARFPLSGRIKLKQQHKKTQMPIQINEDWHKLQGLADVSWFNVRRGLVTRLLPDLLESLQALLFQQTISFCSNSGLALWERKQRISAASRSDASVYFYMGTCSSLEKREGCS